jgi:hypothetical protein
MRAIRSTKLPLYTYLLVRKEFTLYLKTINRLQNLPQSIGRPFDIDIDRPALSLSLYIFMTENLIGNATTFNNSPPP